MEEYFSRFGELSETFVEAFPVTFGRRTLEFAGFTLRLHPQSGSDQLVGTFRVVTRSDGGEIVDITEQDVGLLLLPPAVAEDIYLVKGIRMYVAPETVKTRLRRWVAGLRRMALLNTAGVADAAAQVTPSDLL
jgi:hypothetical protein